MPNYTIQCPVCGKNKLRTRKVAEGWVRQECSACLFLNDIRTWPAGQKEYEENEMLVKLANQIEKEK